MGAYKRLHGRQEIGSRMTWIIEGNPLDLRDFVEERLDHEVLGDTFVAIGDECWDTNEVQMIDNRPILQDARDRKSVV